MKQRRSLKINTRTSERETCNTFRQYYPVSDNELEPLSQMVRLTTTYLFQPSAYDINFLMCCNVQNVVPIKNYYLFIEVKTHTQNGIEIRFERGLQFTLLICVLENDKKADSNEKERNRPKRKAFSANQLNFSQIVSQLLFREILLQY